MQVGCPYLVRCAIDHLICGQNTVLYQLADDVIGDTKLFRRLGHGAPRAILVGRQVSVNIIYTPDG
ncbi:hypothetical protein XM53_17930 [Roseovarius atlanticus]|uniref:Uncharacterized protein n=1 Tax=Roseovarius atlanticus TaxID=1641875 RepID=A0A0T5NQ94_9RHOB|nr:hypothetical protein XM53_17930 [Roseovarius atlanticus]